MDKVFLRTEFNYDMREAGRACALVCLDKSRAQQSGKAEADINTIVRRFKLTGQLPSDVRVPRYVDFESVTTFHEALSLVREAGEAFMRMPAYVRARFGNDPEGFLAFVENPENRDEALKLGILNVPAAKPEPPQAAQPAASPAKAPESAPSKTPVLPGSGSSL